MCNHCQKIGKNAFNVSLCYLKIRGEIGNDLIRSGFEVLELDNSDSVKNDYTSFLRLRSLVLFRKIYLIHSHGTAALVDASLCKIFTPTSDTVINQHN